MTSAAVRTAVLAAHAILLAGLAALGGRVGVVLALPLLAPLRGLWRGAPYTFAWASLLVVFYVGGLFAEGYANPAKRAWLFMLGLVAAIEFIALMLFVRITAAQRRAATAARTAE